MTVSPRGSSRLSADRDRDRSESANVELGAKTLGSEVRRSSWGGRLAMVVEGSLARRPSGIAVVTELGDDIRGVGVCGSDGPDEDKSLSSSSCILFLSLPKRLLILN